MNSTLQYAILILVAVSAVMAVASYFATRREMDDVKGRLGKIEDRPGEAVERFVLKPEFLAHVAEDKQEHANLFSKIGGVERGQLARMDSISGEWRRWAETVMAEMTKEERAGREKIHDRINDVLKAVARLEGEFKAESRK